MTERAPSISVVGTGPVGRALAAAYAAGGGDVLAVVSRDAARGRERAARAGARSGGADLASAFAADVVLICVPDAALADVARRFGEVRGAPSRLLLHTGGALPGDVVRAAGHAAGSLHPLQSFPDLADDAGLASRVAGTHFFHEGDGADAAAAMVAVWRGTLHRLAPGGKALYHAGAAVLSNHAVALFDAALRLFEAAGVPREEAHAPLATLLCGTSANLAAAGVPRALTGPIARGDVSTVRRHLDAIAASAPDLAESYRAMARRALAVARAKGAADVRALNEIAALLG